MGSERILIGVSCRERTFAMPEKRHIVDQIVGKLRKADLELGKSKKVPEVCRLLEVVTERQ